jgi:hypothetical protein
MRCAACGAENRDNANFCNECGTLFSQPVSKRVSAFHIEPFVACPTCGGEVRSQLRTCPGCGADLSATASHEQASVGPQPLASPRVASAPSSIAPEAQAIPANSGKSKHDAQGPWPLLQPQAAAVVGPEESQRWWLERKTWLAAGSFLLLVFAAMGVDWYFGQRFPAPTAANPPDTVPQPSASPVQSRAPAVPEAIPEATLTAPPKPVAAVEANAKVTSSSLRSESVLPAPPQPVAIQALQVNNIDIEEEKPATLPPPNRIFVERSEAQQSLSAVVPARHAEVARAYSIHSRPLPTLAASRRDPIGPQGRAARAEPKNFIEREVERWERCSGKWGKARDCLAYEHNNEGGG